MLGFAFQDSNLVKKAVEMIKENDKLLLVPVSMLMNDDPRQRVRSLNRARRLVKFALKERVGIAVVSFAKDGDYLLSSMQMLEVAKKLGVGDEGAKAMLSRIGDAI